MNKDGNMKEISDKTEACIKLVAEELKHKEMTTAEIKQKYKMSRSEFLNLLNILTFRINLYEYSVGNKVYLGILKRWEDD